MGKKTKLAVAIAAASAAAWAGSKAVAKPQKREDKNILLGNDPIILAYHGGAHLAPDHSLLAFERSNEIGVDGFTVCVRLTKDEEIILYHEEKIDETSNGVGYIKDLTLEQLNEFNHGYNFVSIDGETPYKNDHIRCVTLKEALQTYTDKLFIIDMKDNPDTYEGSLMPSKLWRLIEELNAQDRVIITSDYLEQIDRFNLYAQNSIALGANESHTKKAIATFTSQFGHLYTPKVDVFQVPLKSSVFHFESPKFIQFLSNLNVSILFKGINDLATMNRILKSGAKGIITDRPDIAKILLQKRAMEKQ